MALNSRAMKYVPTSNKKGKIVTLCFGVEAGDVEVIGSSLCGQVLADGARSFIGVIARTPHDITPTHLYSDYTEEDMVSIRLHEAIKAANIGSYQSLYLLNYGELEEVNEELINDYIELINTYRPETIVTFSPLEDDPERIVCLKSVLIALERVKDYKPSKVLLVNDLGECGTILEDKEDLDSPLCYLEVEKSADLTDPMLSVYVSHQYLLTPAISAFDITKEVLSGHVDLVQFVSTILESARDRIIKRLK